MRLTVLVSCIGALLGCTGAIGQPPSGTGEREPPSGSGGAGGTTGSQKGPPSPDTGLRRLTRTEYNNTLHDLLGDTSLAGNALDPDATGGGFDNNADLLKLSVIGIGKYDDAATAVVEAAFRAGSASRAKLVPCDLVKGGATCARSVVQAFARRAWRRPVTGDEVDRLMTALADAAAEGEGVEEGVKLAFRIALVSPNFLYRVEVDAPGAVGLRPVSPHELATRMSYFVWSSTPDDELLTAADAEGEANLGKPAVFAAQLGRLLADRKADALVGNFAAEWLSTRDVATVAPDPKAYPQWKEELRKPIIAEAQGFFRAFLSGDHRDRSVADLLDADFTLVNDSLAKHYGLTGVTGTQMRPVPVAAGSHRFGLLSQAGVLMVTSKPDRTSPVNRGKWVLSRLLCSPPPPPPPKVPTLADSTKAASLPANATIRQRMESHGKDPTCRSCHAAMDPIGFGLERYDGIGRWREVYPGGVSVDATGQLPDGFTFDGAEALSGHLKSDPRFMECFTRTVFAYAMGREPAAQGDKTAIATLGADFAGRGGRMREIIDLVASSQAFHYRGGTP